MMEITGNDIMQLNDTDLRSLIGLLCEADLRSIDVPTAGVTWGGHQDAKDGGIDVRVELTTILNEDNFVPRSKVGFQVKKPDMARNAIISEMRPKGELRKVIKDLIDVKGAYIIVSSQGSTTDSALKDRIAAMKEALADQPNASNIKVDFYDRDRVAGWVRSHPALVLWVRDKIGQPIQGWKAYGNYAKSPGGLEEKYILDEHVRIYNSTNFHSEGLSASEGIDKIRSILHKPLSSVRLVGLSGVGKTRLIQALFDERIGEKPLNPSQVFYCDIGDSPIPDPFNFAERLISLNKPAILAIDNCPPELHNRLTSKCASKGSLVNLITVEYDVKDDQPEETEVFRLEPGSNELIEKIIASRFSHISEVDVRTIAKFSGGNARIAIALARTVPRGENLSNLRDDELFNRLFQQRNGINDSLLSVGEICSLVYSFNCEDNEELNILGSLIGIGPNEVYRQVSELRRRDLVQVRNVWRAVLPHAIANKLAKRALENIPVSKICDIFEKDGATRLLKSFSRRLSYLHQSTEALLIAEKWLSEGGRLELVNELDDFDFDLFKNIAPINLEMTLTAIERVSNHEEAEKFFSRENNRHYIMLTRILRSLAYESELFDRSINLLCRFALSEKVHENNNSIRDLLKSLFYIKFSGTHASAEQRLQTIEGLVDSGLQDSIQLGISLLDATLESWHFSSYHEFQFGARSRDYGFDPDTKEEVKKWYRLFIEYTTKLAISNSAVGPMAKTLLAEKFRGLWKNVKMYNELEFAARQIFSKESWREGWIAIRNTRRFDSGKMDKNTLARLNALEDLLKSTTLIEKAKLYALSNETSALDLIDALEDPEKVTTETFRKVNHITQSLGCEVALDNNVFKEMLPDILINDSNRLFYFGLGLAEGCSEPKKMWKELLKQLSFIKESDRKYRVLGGFLKGISEINNNISEEILDEAVSDELLREAYPWLQARVKINEQGIKRLKQSLNLEKTPIQQYIHLDYEKINQTINEQSFIEILQLIASKEGGVQIAVEIFENMIHSYNKSELLSNNFILYGQDLLLNYEFSRKNFRRDPLDYELSKIVSACFIGQSAQVSAETLCNKLLNAYLSSKISSRDYGQVLKAISLNQPVAFLNIFLGNASNSEKSSYIKQVILENSIVSKINDDFIIEWCELNPTIRYQILASVIIPYQKNGNLLEWTPLALKIMNKVSDPIKVLKEFKSRFTPKSWSGSLTEILKSRLSLIEDLKQHEHFAIASWANRAEKLFREEINSVHKWEIEAEKDWNERFEY
ncbi:hypothetical protein CN902_27430 [Priestia megaterium]|uniref:hypothetical protein n=1 Tax=Priestia megaterium TaxID=1404 RepID=UPI000BFDC2DA|nr:hypothetical protein [Priestia megaterium]PGK21412.1 hypothetical protein CN902_27430 [Priestia megaterium]